MTIICFDPGNHTGWVARKGERMLGGTLLEKDMYKDLTALFAELNPDIVVYETFNLYPGLASHLAWNSFYPCEIIGIIKYLCWQSGIKCIGQAPPVKKYAGKLDVSLVQEIKEYAGKNFTEHTKDALLHYMFFARKQAK